MKEPVKALIITIAGIGVALFVFFLVYVFIREVMIYHDVRATIALEEAFSKINTEEINLIQEPITDEEESESVGSIS